MILLLAVIALLHLPSNADPFRDHLSEALKLKCDALPYRTAFVDDRCFVAVLQEIEYSEAAAQCSSIFSGSKVSTDVPASVFEALMVEKSKVHTGSASSGAKHLICSYDNGYKCDASETMLSNGRCVIRASKKMNFAAAQKYCGDLGMGLPAPANDLDNRIIRDSLGKDPAWVDRSFVRNNGFKWEQGKSYSRWSTCNYTAGHKPRLYSGTQNNLWQCRRDVATVGDRNGYWSNGGVEYEMEVICIKGAENPFTAVGSPCNYHDSNFEVSPQPTGAACRAKTCYTHTRTTTRYEILGKGTVETQRGCEVFCDSKPQCIAFTFEDRGFSSSCILLSSTFKEICRDATTIFLKKTSGCAAQRTNLTAEFGVDPCIDEMVPSVFRGLEAWRICEANKEHPYLVRAVDACGRRITLDNDRWNWIQHSGMDRKGDMFEFVYLYDGYRSVPIPIVAASCVLAGSAKCPCKPLKQLPSVPHAPYNPHLYAAVTERINPCRGQSAWFWWDVVKHPGFVQNLVTQWATTQALITCKAGMWMLRNIHSDNSWGITAGACYG